MTSQVAQILPFANLTRGGFGLSPKSRNMAKTSENNEDWYIPYNGPYEAPRELPNRRRARDSWGDLVEPDDDEDDTALHDKELRLRYGGNNPTDRKSGGGNVEGVRMDRNRGRSFSVTSGHTVSSGTIDPNRPNIGTNRRSTPSAGTRPAVPSYVSLDAVGRVGESPIPRRNPKEGGRMSLAGIFHFNTQPRKPSPPPASVEHSGSNGYMRKPSFLQRSNIRTVRNDERVHSKTDPPVRDSSSPEQHANLPARNKHQLLHHHVMSQADRLTAEEDYYQSYYSTLIREQRSEPTLGRHRHSPSLSEDLNRSHQQSPSDHSSLNRQNSASPSSGHPYALATPRDNVENFSRAPEMPPSNPPALTFTAPSHNPSSLDSHNTPSTRRVGPKTPKLTNSISTPDMRNSASLHDAVVTTVIPPKINAVPQRIAAPDFVFPKVKDRWLSAETWCDALLFPRPRLRVGNVPTLGGSGRIVSPPGSPLEPDSANPTKTRAPGIASRVLAHSRSLVDLNKPTAFSSYTYPQVSPSTSRGQNPQAPPVGTQSRSPWPGGFTQDDLAFPTAAPSLEHILEQGQRLANEREAWQTQAKNSFGNQRTRILSRTRSKSLTQKGRRKGHQLQSSMEYLAAQACLGNQNLTPNLGSTELGVIVHNNTYTSSLPGRSHSHSSSHARTLSKSSKSHSKGDSWSKSAAKMAKSTVAICGFSASEEEISGGDVLAGDLEGALRRDGTKVIRLADPACIPVDYGLSDNTSPSNSARLTPSPSDNNDQGVGIALGTPQEDDQNDSYYLPSHPYARGGGSGFAGPHPSINSGVDIPPISDILARHKLPPHLLLHPYAQASARDSYLDQNGLLAQYRSNDDTPKQMKMWAQLSPGVLREVLPGDIQYSPLTPEKENPNSILISDTIGVGETLANAAQFRSPDRSIGANDSDAHIMAAKPLSQADWDKQPQNALPEFGLRTIRKPELSEDSEALGLVNQVLPAPAEQPPTIQFTDRAASASPTSECSSSFFTPHHLGGPHDLESFQDLFYRPTNSLGRNTSEAALPDTPNPPNITTGAWDRNMQRPRSHRTESGLTSLARQLSQEFELMALERGRSGSQYSSKPSSSRQHSSNISKRPTDDSLEFLFEETDQSELLPELTHPAIHAFQPSGSLPEDVESSRASSLIERLKEGDDNDTTMVRLRVIESSLTPPTVPPEHRPNSYAGETSGLTINEGCQQTQPESPSGISGEARTRTLSGLRPPSSDATRTSVVSTSTVSRMSNLSDFPVPPKDNHISIGAYFNEALSQRGSQPEIPLPPCPQEQQVFFGRNQDAGDLAKTLSSVL